MKKERKREKDWKKKSEKDLKAKVIEIKIAQLCDNGRGHSQ